MIKVGDKVKHIRYPRKEFIVQKVDESFIPSTGIRWFQVAPIDDRSNFFWCEESYVEQLVDFDPFGFQLIDEEDDEHTCTEGQFPISLKEKNFEPWYVCRKCGLALRKAEACSFQV